MDEALEKLRRDLKGLEGCYIAHVDLCGTTIQEPLTLVIAVPGGCLRVVLRNGEIRAEPVPERER